MQNISRRLTEYNNSTARIQNKCILVKHVKEKLSDLFSRRIRELGIKNVDVANRSGLSRGYIGNIVNETAPTQSGQYNLSPESVNVLAKALEISESAILEAMNYLPENQNTGIKKPSNPAEFFDALDRLGLDIQFAGGRKVLEGLDEDDLQELLDTVIASATAKGRRKQARI